MIQYLDSDMLLFVLAAICVASYFTAIATDGVLGGDGFGVIGNMLILMTGAIIGLFSLDYVDVPLQGHVAGAVAAISGGFIILTVMSLIKNILSRAGL